MAEANKPRFWAVVPAAGKGSRFGASIPKQYLPLAGSTVLEHALTRLLNHASIHKVVVAVSPGDEQWAQLASAQNERVTCAVGGTERCHSVLNALESLKEEARPEDWVLVHDAARPCLRLADIDRLIEELADHPVGGLLGIPVADTLKRCDAQAAVTETVDREGLWRALTPQMFRVGALTEALRNALDEGYLVTDEASAIEHRGLQPRMVAGHADNIKITHPQDLALAELFLEQQKKERG